MTKTEAGERTRLASAEAAARAAAEGDGWGAAAAILSDGEAVKRAKRAAEKYWAVDRDLAEDIVVDSLVALKRKVDDGKGAVENPVGFVAGTAINLARAETRRRKKLGELPLDPERDQAPDPFEELDDSEQEISDEDADAIGRLQALAEQIGQDRPREVVEYLLEAVRGGRLEEISHSDVGEALGISPGAAKVARLRGIERLRELVLEEDERLAVHLKHRVVDGAEPDDNEDEEVDDD